MRQGHTPSDVPRRLSRPVIDALGSLTAAPGNPEMLPAELMATRASRSAKLKHIGPCDHPSTSRARRRLGGGGGDADVRSSLAGAHQPTPWWRRHDHPI